MNLSSDEIIREIRTQLVFIFFGGVALEKIWIFISIQVVFRQEFNFFSNLAQYQTIVFNKIFLNLFFLAKFKSKTRIFKIPSVPTVVYLNKNILNLFQSRIKE